jgi:hypothetical protein
MMLSMKKFALLIVAIVAIVAVSGGQTSAAPDPGGGVTPSPSAGFDVDIRTLPQTDTGPTKIQAILGIVFGVIGALSLLMITVGGFRYIMAEGDPQAAGRAKSTIIYALIGLIVSITSVAIVTFVLGRVT